VNMREEIKAYVDGELTPDLNERVRLACDEDSVLGSEAAFYRLLGPEIQGLAKEPAVVGADTVLERVRKGRRFTLKPYAVPLALMAIVAVGGVLNSSKSGGLSASADSVAAASAPVSGMVASTKFKNPAASSGIASAKAISANPAYVAPPTSWRSSKGKLPAYVSVTEDSRANLQGNAPARQENSDLSINGTLPVPHRPPAPSLGQFSASEGRMVVQNGDIQIAVRDVSKAQSDAMAYARSIGGFATSSSLEADADGELPHAGVTLRVPVAQFSAAMDYLKHMAASPSDLISLQVGGEDVTGQFADTSARLRVLRAEEESYVGMLRGLRHVEDILAVKDRLSDVRQQIESLESQAAALRDTSALSTINASFTSKVDRPKARPAAVPQPPNWSSQTWADASGGMQGLTRMLATISIYLFVYSPFWVPLGLIGWWFTRRRY
jgi:hypothetical protein